MGLTNIGVILDFTLSFKSPEKSTTKSVFLPLQNISGLQPSLSDSGAKIITTVLLQWNPVWIFQIHLGQSPVCSEMVTRVFFFLLWVFFLSCCPLKALVCHRPHSPIDTHNLQISKWISVLAESCSALLCHTSARMFILNSSLA